MTEVLTAQSPSSGSPYLSSSSIHQTQLSGRSFVLETATFEKSDISAYTDDLPTDAESEASSVPSSPRPERSSPSSTPPSSISLDLPTYCDEELYFPTYGDQETSRHDYANDLPPYTEDAHHVAPAHSPATPTNESILDSPLLKPVDDTAIHDEPTRQVDYLSHDWREEDISLSWRHIVANRKTFGERSRLENASWRTWAKSKYRLKTVSPEQLNWQKECDVTWLYGPLQEARKLTDRPRKSCQSNTEFPQANGASGLSKTDSFVKRPILKKRSVSEVMLQKSLSSSSLVKQAAAAAQAQIGGKRKDADHRFHRSESYSIGRVSSTAATGGFASMISSEQSSGLVSPEAGGGKHIRFDDKVEQCIAVDFKPGGSSDDMISNWSKELSLSPESSDDDLFMMRTSHKRQSSTPGSRRDSIGQESKGIAKLPSTTLKYHHDEPYCPGHPDASSIYGRGQRLQASSSQETLRPAKPSANFLVDEAEDDLSWEPSGAFDTPRPGNAAGVEGLQVLGQEQSEAPSGLRRTPSGMFMPFEGEDEQNFSSNGVFGRVVDTVNTARDIFSVIMNVGWRS